MEKSKLRPIILAGGSGKRLWPLSTKEKPKQFIPLFGEYSLFDLTLQRINKKSLFKSPIIVTSEKYIRFVEKSIERTGVEPDLIVLEPLSKNTFPAISLAVMLNSLKNKNETFFVAPSDHYISKNNEFHETCNKAKDKVIDGSLILFGIRPEMPSPEYGYILSDTTEEVINEVIAFVEKPDKNLAKKILKKPSVFWNAGMFLFNQKWFLNACKENNLEGLNEISNLIPNTYPKDLYFKPNKEKFKLISDIAFDKALVEDSNKTLVTQLDAGWSDLGSWTSLRALQKDPESRMTLFTDTYNFRVEKPWGFYETIMETGTSKVKLLSVLPGHKLSLQKHKHRSETWHVIRGEAKVTKGNERFSMLTGDSVIINKNEVHRLENSSNESLEIVEIQTGTYFGEDDIVRIEDSYGRVGLH